MPLYVSRDIKILHARGQIITRVLHKTNDFEVKRVWLCITRLKIHYNHLNWQRFEMLHEIYVKTRENV